jgi:hypothetical protein
LEQSPDQGVQGVSRKEENTAFVCEYCDRPVLPVNNGSYRNHCPFCLSSKHVDITPGDRMNTCGGLMKPTGLVYKSGKGFQIIHRCASCGAQTVNKVAEDTTQPDDVAALAMLAQGRGPH